jgi:hypothetical protein
MCLELWANRLAPIFPDDCFWVCRENIGNDIIYACSTNAERNLIKDNNVANILKTPSKKR